MKFKTLLVSTFGMIFFFFQFWAIGGVLQEKEVDFRSLNECNQIPEGKIKKYLGMNSAEYSNVINNSAFDTLPMDEISGYLDFMTIYEDIKDETGKLVRFRSNIPTVNDTVIYPYIRANGFDNFIPGGGVDAEKVLNVNFKKLPIGTKIKVKGRRSFLLSGYSYDCRTYGESLMVFEAEFNGKSYQLTDEFSGILSKESIAPLKSDLFVLMGTTNSKEHYDPINFFMDRTIRIKISDDLKKRQLLTAWLNPVTKVRAGKQYLIRLIGYSAYPQGGNSWDPNWSFNLDQISFRPRGTRMPEICDGTLGQVESSFRSYRHYKISELDHFCPWGAANEIVAIQDGRGKALSESEIKNLLEGLGGSVSDFE